MKSVSLPFLTLTTASCLLLSCEKQQSVQVDQTRELTTADTPVELEVTSAERFEPPASNTGTPSNIAAVAGPGSGSSGESEAFTYITPEGWTQKASTPFRAVNMTFGDSGEVYVSRVGGDILGNLNRWYGQFGADTLSKDELAQLETIPLAGQNGYFITASGTYNAGMGRPAKENAALLGAVARDQDKLITVKLIAPQSSAQAQRDAFLRFCASLKNQ